MLHLFLFFYHFCAHVTFLVPPTPQHTSLVEFLHLKWFGLQKMQSLCVLFYGSHFTLNFEYPKPDMQIASENKAQMFSL